MTEPAGTDHHPAGGSGGGPVLDLGAVLAAMQDQIDDLTAAVEAQQRTLDELARDRSRPGAGAGGQPAGGTGTGLR